MPSDFELTDERLRFAISEGLTEAQARREFAKFRDHEFKDPRSKWNQAWQNWARRAAETAPRAADSPRSPGGPRSLAPQRDEPQRAHPPVVDPDPEFRARYEAQQRRARGAS